MRDVAAPLTGLQVVTEPLGGSPLSLAAQRGEVPEHWYTRRPASVDEWRAHAERVARGFSGGRWLAALEPALGPAGEAASRLRKAAAGGVVVTTGQQPGLFGGPAYTLNKALTALTLADELQDCIGLPVAPVFWAATDDADFEEARWTSVVVDGTLRRLEVNESPRPGTPMSEAPLGDVGTQLADLIHASGSAAFARAIDAVREAYRPGATVGGAYVDLLRALLEPLGIAVLDASHPAVRRHGAALLRDALRRATDVAAALTARAVELRAAGFEPQVADAPELSLVFAASGGAKRRVPVDEAGAVVDSAEPALLGPNVLLRPVLERSLLPTVGYAAGPAELAYFAQVSAAADALGAERPLVVPRWSATVIEPHVNRILARLGVRYADLRDPHAVEGRLARADLPSGVVAALQAVRDTVERSAAALASDADASRLVPVAAVAGAKRVLLDRVQRLERRYAAAVKRREEKLMRDVGTARVHLYPNGERQERALSFVPMLARQGPALLRAMRDAARSHARSLVGPNPAVAGSGAAAAPEGAARP